eukprot:1161990-Pelagomonas_calceolata.AAC.10
MLGLCCIDFEGNVQPKTGSWVPLALDRRCAHSHHFLDITDMIASLTQREGSQNHDVQGLQG